MNPENNSTRGVELSMTSAIESRHSVRSFHPDPVPSATIQKIFRLAQHTPSWCNVQPWSVAIADRPRLDEIAISLTKAITRQEFGYDVHAPHSYDGEIERRRQECGSALYETLQIQREDRDARDIQMLQNYHFYNAPHAIFVIADSSIRHYSYVDAGAYMMSFMLAAQGLQLGTIVLGAPARYSPAMRRELGLDDSQRFVAAIAFGFEDTSHVVNQVRTQRAPIESVIRQL